MRDQEVPYDALSGQLFCLTLVGDFDMEECVSASWGASCLYTAERRKSFAVRKIRVCCLQ